MTPEIEDKWRLVGELNQSIARARDTLAKTPGHTHALAIQELTNRRNAIVATLPKTRIVWNNQSP
jgi:hypothetical protein